MGLTEIQRAARGVAEVCFEHELRPSKQLFFPLARTPQPPSQARHKPPLGGSALFPRLIPVAPEAVPRTGNIESVKTVVLMRSKRVGSGSAAQRKARGVSEVWRFGERRVPEE